MKKYLRIVISLLIIVTGLVFVQVTQAQTECTPFIYSEWSACSVDAKQTRTVLSSGPETCTGGDPVISQTCKRPPPKITSISPSATNRNEIVEVIGENFGATKGSSRVFGPGNREQTTGTWADTKISVNPNNFEDPRGFYLMVERSHESETSPVKSNVFSLKILPWGPPKITSITRKVVTSQGTEAWIHGENFGMPNNPDVSVSNAQVYETNGTSHKIVLREHDVIRVLVNLDDLKRPNGRTSFYVKVKCLDDECFGAVDGPDGKDYVSNSFFVDVASTPPPCATDTWSCGDWNTCSISGSQTRTCNKTFDCPSVDTTSPVTSQSCTPPSPSCTTDTWDCNEWSVCSANGNQSRACTKTFDCQTVNTPSPAISQSCTPPPVYQPPQPTCDADTWTCGDWNSCSLSGVQSRSCRKTFDCANVETAPPSTDQYCEAPNRPAQQIPQNSSDEISNQDAIIKSTVKLLCPVDAQRASQGSGTIIDSNGTILTNKHVIAGTLGCLVGFINDFNDEPYFGDRHIADITKISPNQDIAILKIRNPQNKNLTSVNITKGSSNLRLGTKVTTYGFPAKFGTKVTYTSGDFSGTDGSYIKTTAILEYGNSGGGAYLKDGTFIGIPSAVVKGELNALGYILSINTINSWLGNSSTAYGGTSNNNYSRVSVLEDIDLKKLGSLKLFIPDTDTKGNLATPTTSQNTQKTTNQPKINQTQKESIVIVPADTNQKVNPERNNLKQSESVQKIKELPKRFYRWLRNLF
ncbi:MAG: trypsin-like peptidase domain-containing protein [Parcubacteria group bacterium]|nr:trypsin-like peptidase domain-containing protein [Parcubacteria group bacterium]